jgi:hypothetical protein
MALAGAPIGRGIGRRQLRFVPLIHRRRNRGGCIYRSLRDFVDVLDSQATPNQCGDGGIVAPAEEREKAILPSARATRALCPSAFTKAIPSAASTTPTSEGMWR